MQINKLESKEQFDQLKKGDIVVVEWKPSSMEHRKGRPITSNHIWGMHNGNELILDKRTNSYINVDMYLRGESHAKEVYVLTQYFV
ncbi:hypothetical protein P9302_25795 [Brevibacillus agri]|uniref:hypothetical protein n=1 Tax=Brevibacillus agri TaxID=51101 RepID=UPI002E2224CD|nr:hypothetical protein [Brevibacillus agri]